MKIMTANLCSWGEGENSIPQRMPRVKKIFENYMPQLLCVQESTDAWSTYLKAELSDYGIIGLGREPGFKGEASHILYLKNELELIEEQTFWLSDTPEQVSLGWDGACRRVCTRGVFSEKSTGLSFACYNTHLDHIGAVSQLEGAKLIKSRMEEEQLPLLLSGDFNVNRGSEAYGVFAAFLKDTRPIDAVGGSWHSFGEIKNMESELPIDHIFASKAWELKAYHMLKDKVEDKYPSDHYFVMAELLLG